jgi:hypothetical protein
MEPPYVPVSAETVTEDWVKRVLANEFGVAPAEAKTRIDIVKLDVSAGALRTDGFLSRMQRIVVKARLANDPPESTTAPAGDTTSTAGDAPVVGKEKALNDEQETREFHLVAKLHPPNELHRKMVSS